MLLPLCGRCTSMAQSTASTTLRNSLNTIPCPLDDAAMMHGDGGIDQIAAQRPYPRKRALLVGTAEPAVSDYIRRQYRR